MEKYVIDAVLHETSERTTHSYRRNEMQEAPQNEVITQMDPEQEKALETRWKEMVEDLVYNHGFSPRKARRYLESEARRNHRRLIREGKRRQDALRKAGKLVDTSDIAAQLDQELAEQLAALPSEGSDAVTVDIETHNYKSPTDQF